MRVEQVECVLAVARTGSFRQAASELGITQQSLSETVRNLERELGATLLVRGRGSVSLSETGTAVLEHLEHVVAAGRAVREEIGAQSGVLRGSLRIGAVAAATNTVLPRSVTRFLDLNPRVELRVFGAGSSDIAADVRSGDLDIGLITILSDEEPPVGVVFEPLAASELVVCLPDGHALAGQASIGVDELIEERWVVYRRGYMMHRVLEQLVDTSTIDIVFTTDNTDSAKAMIAAGVGVTILPEFSSTPKPPGLVTRPLTGVGRSVVLGIVVRTGATTTRVPAEFVRILHEQAHSTTSVSVRPRS